MGQLLYSFPFDLFQGQISEWVVTTITIIIVAVIVMMVVVVGMAVAHVHA